MRDVGQFLREFSYYDWVLKVKVVIMSLYCSLCDEVVVVLEVLGIFTEG